MKALKSKLASDLLADPQAREQLRTYLATKGAVESAARNGITGRFIIHRQAGSTPVNATVVAKAAKAAKAA